MPYGTDQGLTDWLVAQGHGLPADSPPLSALRARASAYVDGYEPFWTGQRTGGVMQEEAWPRTGGVAGCTVPIPDDVIPVAVVTATYRAAWLEGSAPGTLAAAPIAAGTRVKRQKVDVIEREFFEDRGPERGSGPSFIDPMIDGLLGAFICDQKGGAFMWTLGS